jgi:hypothetical protein
MDMWSQVAQKLPVGGEPGQAIRDLRGRIAEQADDMRAFSHVELYKCYYSEAQKRPLLAKAFRHLARYHVEEAVASSQL